MTKFGLRLLAVVLVLACWSAARAEGRHDYVRVGGDINIAEGDVAADVVCVFCSVQVHGDVHGDVAVVLGNVTLDAGHTISGDVAVVGGSLTAGDNTSLGGDVAIVGGELNLDPGATLRGGRTVLGGWYWMLVPLLPFAVVFGILWLIVRLVRRNRYVYPAYPGARM